MTDVVTETGEFPIAARELVAAARTGEISVADFRDREVDRAVRLLERGRSVLLTGPEGVGKTAVIYGVAHAMARRGEGGASAAIHEFSTAMVLSGTKYLGEWQTRIVEIAAAAERSGAVLYVTDVWNLPQVGRWSGGDDNLFDALRPYLEGRRIRIVAEAGSDVLPVLQRERGFVDLFETVAVEPLDGAQVDEVVRRAFERAGLAAGEATRRALIDLSSRFTPSRPQPGPALNLLRQVADYQAQRLAAGKPVDLSPAFVEEVFSIYSGLPLFVVSRGVTRPAREIRDWFRARIVGQVDAIDAVVEAIALFKAGLHDPNRPLGTFLFVGPTGVGKTELARALAEFLFGSPNRLLRFDLSEFKDHGSILTLLGDPENPRGEARLVDPVRAQPFQVVLFDELEKAHQNVWDLLLPLLDEGRLTPPGGRAVNFRNTLLIATSNAGAQESGRALGFGAEPADPARRADRVREELERVFRPELLNRFQHIAVFHPLTRDQVRTIALQELGRVLRREGITARNLVVDVADDALQLVIDRGFDPRYGARALKREIQTQLVLPLAMTLMERRLDPGSILRLSARGSEIRVVVHDSEPAREARRELEPVVLPEGRRLGRAEVAGEIEQAARRIEELAAAAGEAALRAERDRLAEVRQRPEFWSRTDAVRALRDLDRAGAVLERLDRLRARAEAIAAAAAGAQLRRELVDLAHRLAQLDEAVAVARRELVAMGPGGIEDALVEVRPLGEGGRPARDLLVTAYQAWAVEGRRFRVDWLREPLAGDEPALFAVRGNHAFGYLALEAGLHKLRTAEAHGAAAVRVAPWLAGDQRVAFGAHRALKGTGQYGGAIRSRLECEGGLVLQNARTLAENRELAAELAGAWPPAEPGADAVVRRYDTDPFLVRDALTDTSTGRPDALSPARLHALLCRRIDEAAQRR